MEKQTARLDIAFWRWLAFASAALLLLLNPLIAHLGFPLYELTALLMVVALYGILRLLQMVADAADPQTWYDSMKVMNPKGVQKMVRLFLILLPIAVVLYALFEGLSSPLVTASLATWLFFLLAIQRPVVPPLPYPQPPVPLPAKPEPGPEVQPAPGTQEASVVKRYVWSYLLSRGAPERVFTQLLTILQKNVDAYRSRPRILDSSKWTHYPLSISPEVIACAGDLRQKHQDSYFSSFDEICNTICFVQHFPYSYDEQSIGQAEYPRYPLETLYDETGDCECLSILGASLLKILGYEVALLDYPQHIALGVAGADLFEGAFFVDATTGRRYYYVELTSEGWQVGEVPADLRNVTPRILPVQGQFDLLK